MAGQDPVDSKMSSRFKDTLHRANPMHHRPLSLFSKPKLPDIHVIYLIGGPSSGKTSIATMLAQEYPLVHLIPSEVISQVQNSGSYEQKQLIKDSTNPVTGELPDEALCVLIRKLMQRAMEGDKKWFLIEGVPATLSQFKRFDKEFGCEMIIGIQTSSDEMEKRHMAPEMPFVDAGERKADLDARRREYFANLTLMGKDRTFKSANLQWVDGEKDPAEIMKVLRPIMNKQLNIEERTEKPAPQSEMARGGATR